MKSFTLVLTSISFLLISLVFFNTNLSTLAQINTTPPVLCPNCALFNIGDRLKNKDFTNAYFASSNFGDQFHVNSTDMSGTTFNGAYMDSNNFHYPMNLDNAKFKNAILTNTTFSNVHGVNINFKNSDLDGASLTNLIFQNANFTGASIRDDAFLNSDLTGSNMTGVIANGGTPADFNNTNLTNVNFTNANLTGAINMSTANVTGVTWSNTICPDGTNSNSNGNTCVGHF